MAGGAMAANAPGASRSILKTGIIRREYLWAFILVTSLFFLWGFAYGLLDVLNKHFQNILGITRTQSTGLQAAYFGIGYFAYSPVAAEILKRKGYKVAIISGLGLYSLGAILFWPVAKFSIGTTNPGAIFAGFVVCTAVIACGLATLEVAANSYVTVMPPHNIAGLRLQFSQSFNGVASFTGPLIASKFFFSGAHADDLSTVQYVYMAVAGLGVVVALAFFFTKLPEVSEEALQAEAEALAHAQGIDSGLDKPFWKQVRPLTGFVAQFLYVGAQVTIGSFFLFYTEAVAKIPDSTGSQLLSYGLITFTVCRFIGTALLSVVAAPVLLAFCALGSLIMVICISSLHGTGGVVCLIAVMGFESIMYPVIFVLGTTGLGHHTRRAAGLLVMGVAGGAVLPPIQGAISDIGLVGKVSKASSVQKSFLVCVPCFAYIFCWSVWIWHKDGRRWTPAKENREIEREVEAASGSAYPAAATGLSYTGEKTGAGGHYEGSEKEDLERVERL